MSKNKFDHFQDHLEWEILYPEQEITNISFEIGLYSLSKDCIIKFSRNNQYDLVATISGIAENFEQLEPNIEKIKGTFIAKETITGYSKDGLFKYKLFGIVLGSAKSTFSSTNIPSINFHADLIVDRIEKSFNEVNTESVSIQEWYLSGKSGILFPRGTKRIVDKAFKKLRVGIDNEDESRLIKSKDLSNDYLSVKLTDTSFIVSKVPIGYGPDWSFNISIEYRQSFGRIPDENEREAISELVSFIFGNQLLRIGQTSYDNTASLILEEYKSPWGDNVVSRCEKKSFAPVEIEDYEDWGRAEILLNELIPKYLSQREALQFKDALWKYWIAKYSSLGINLPILSSAVESLAERVLINHPEIKPYYIEFNEFVELIKDELCLLEKKLDININKDKIINKVKGAAQRGSNEKLEMMFEIIKLPIDKIERKALKARNKMAHSSLGYVTDEEIKETIRLTRAYETLFNRIFLKILSYNGQYIDYYTLGHPTRHIDEPIPE